jgi:cyclic pyranopterin phosphate synthase
VTLSDRVFQGVMEDTSGPAIAKFFETRGARVSEVQVIPDDLERIRNRVSVIANSGGINCLVLTGGTGIAPRDVTPEALAPLWTKAMPGIGELLRASGAKFTPMSYLSRSEGGLIGECLVLSLPGSENAVREGLDTLAPMLAHLFHVKAGGKHSS